MNNSVTNNFGGAAAEVAIDADRLANDAAALTVHGVLNGQGELPDIVAAAVRVCLLAQGDDDKAQATVAGAVQWILERAAAIERAIESDQPLH